MLDKRECRVCDISVVCHRFLYRFTLKKLIFTLHCKKTVNNRKKLIRYNYKPILLVLMEVVEHIYVIVSFTNMNFYEHTIQYLTHEFVHEY